MLADSGPCVIGDAPAALHEFGCCREFAGINTSDLLYASCVIPCGFTREQLEGRSAFDRNCVSLIVDKIYGDAASKTHAIGQLGWRQMISINWHGDVTFVVPSEIPICCGIRPNHALAHK